MTTTFTPIYRMAQMTPGDQAVRSAWGPIANASWLMAEQGGSGRGVVDLTGLTSHTLTTANNAPDEARNNMMFFVGAPAGPCPVTIPARARVGWSMDATTGGQPITLTTGGTAQNLTLVPGLTAFWQTDGAGIYEIPIHIGAQPSLIVNGNASVGGALSVGGGLSSGPINANGNIATTAPGQGNVQLTVGGPANNGYVGFINPSGVRSGYIGFGLNTLNIQADGANAWQIGGSFLTVNSAATVTGRIQSNQDVLINSVSGGLYYSSFNGFEWHSYVEPGSADKITLYRSQWYDRWENATGTRRWAAPAGYIMTLDGSGNLYTSASMTSGYIRTTGAFMCDSGIFYVANNTNYYHGRSGGDGFWRYVENGTINCTIGTNGAVYARTDLHADSGTVWAQQFMAYNGTFYVANNFAYYLQRGGDGVWRFVEAGAERFAVAPNGDTFAQGNMRCNLDISGNRLFTNYNHSAGNCDADNDLNAGQAVNGNYLHSRGNVQADNDLDAVNSVNAGFMHSRGNIDAAGTFTGGGVSVNNVHSNGNMDCSNDCNVGQQVNCQHIVANAGGAALTLPNGAGFAAGGFFGSDARWKTNIRDISDDEAVEWVMLGRPRHATIEIGDERHETGCFVAQEEIASGRSEPVRWMPSDDPRVADGDAHSPPGMRAFYDYNSHIAYLTKALQYYHTALADALKRIERLERGG